MDESSWVNGLRCALTMNNLLKTNNNINFFFKNKYQAHDKIINIV